MKLILLATLATFTAVACEKKTVIETPTGDAAVVSTPSANKLKVKGDWNTTKGKLKQKYAELTDDDLLYVEGKEDELYGRLQKRLGKSREEVEQILQAE
ncbi:MAG: CsbD family protein [Verrucomicrobiaceae bacterium]|nr:MAG: CsbD family protein [Verrucomicrobiaceae bacterium]